MDNGYKELFKILTKGEDADLSASASVSCSTAMGEDQKITIMPECCIHPMCALKGKPLGNRNGMMICPTCGDSYGKR